MNKIAVAASNDLAGDELFVDVINFTRPDLLHRDWFRARVTALLSESRYLWLGFTGLGAC